MKRLSIILLCLGLAVIWPGDSFGGKKNMDILLKNINDKDKLPKLEPAKYELAEAGLTHGEEIWNIFQVPRDNSIGTNDLNNAITLLKFKGDKMEFEEIRRNFLKDISVGNCGFLSPLSKDEIGYDQTRAFFTFNLKTKEYREIMICDILEEEITGVYPIDLNKKTFLFKISYFSMQMDHPRSTFRLMDLSGQEKKLIREPKLPGWPLAISNKFILLDGGDALNVVDMNFSPARHSLATFYNQKISVVGELKEMIVHDYYPFAVFSTNDNKHNDNGLWLITWKDKTYPELIYVAEKKPDHDWKNIQFSPDGKWLVLIDKHDDANTDYYAVPIDKQNVVYLGLTPIYLGTIAFPINSTWIAKPQSFVVTTGKELYKWELDDRALKMIPKRQP